jgi:hypothetical protein
MWPRRRGCRIKTPVAGHSLRKMGSESCLCWNIRGLNSGARRDSVTELVRSERISLIYLQETRLDVISDYDVMQILGLGFDYVCLPIVHTGGGGGSSCLEKCGVDGYLLFHAHFLGIN